MRRQTRPAPTTVRTYEPMLLNEILRDHCARILQGAVRRRGLTSSSSRLKKKYTHVLFQKTKYVKDELGTHATRDRRVVEYMNITKTRRRCSAIGGDGRRRRQNDRRHSVHLLCGETPRNHKRQATDNDISFSKSFSHRSCRGRRNSRLRSHIRDRAPSVDRVKNRYDSIRGTGHMVLRPLARGVRAMSHHCSPPRAHTAPGRR